MLGGKQEEQKKKEKGLPEKLATGALIAGGIAAGVAAARDPRVQYAAQRAGSATKDKIKDFLVNFSEPRDVDVDIVDASSDVTPNPRLQQANTAPNQNTDVDVAGRKVSPELATAIDRFTPLSEGKTSFTEGAISKEDPYGDISNLEQRVDRTYGKFLSNLKPEDAAKTRESLIRGAARERDYALGYMNAMARGRTDEQAAITGRKFAGYDLSPAVKPQTPFREALSELKIASTVPAKIDDLLKLVETGPQIILPEKAQNQVDGSSAIVLAGGGNNTNVIPTMGATIGGPSLTDQLATKMAVDNALDNVRAKLTGTPVPITGVRIEGPSNIQKTGPGNLAGQRELPIIYSTDRETNQQMRRIEPTDQQLLDIRQEQGEVATDRKGNMMITSPTYDSITGFKSPSTESISTNPLEERISRLEGKTAELRAIQENLSKAGELMSAGLDPRTTRFDSARATGLTSKTGIEPRITNPRFQENMNLGKVQEAALPKPAARAYFEQDSEGRIIPATMEQRSGDRRVVKGPDTKTITSGGGYQPRGGVGSSIGAYGLEPTDFAEAKISQTPTESPTSFTQAPGRARGPIDIVVSGGRANNNKFDTRTGGGYEGFKAEMDNIISQMGIPEGKTINIVSGGASGVDAYAAQYATEKQQKGGNFTSEIMEADWSKGGTLPPAAPGQKPVADVNYDPKAGGERNQRMINKAEAAIIFDGGSGTKDFTERAQEEQKTRRFPVYNASDMKGSKNRFAGESLDVARQLQKIQNDQSVSPEQRRINAASFIENLETDAILRSIDYS